MTDEALSQPALFRLMAWLSPAYPIGAFSYSSGIEWAVEAGDIKDAETLHQWLAGMIGAGSGFSDAVLFVHAHRAIAANDDAALRAAAELAAALVTSKERLLETTAQGRAFLDATRAAWPCPALARLDAVWQGAVALPIAVGVTCAGHGIGCEPALHAFLHGLAANWISAGVRLDPARPDRWPACAGRAGRRHRRLRGARAHDPTRRSRRLHRPRRYRRHAARDAVHALVPLLTGRRIAAGQFDAEDHHVADNIIDAVYAVPDFIHARTRQCRPGFEKT